MADLELKSGELKTKDGRYYIVKRPGFLRRFFTRIFVLIGVMTVLSCIVINLVMSEIYGGGPADLPEKILLSYDFKPGLGEIVSGPSLDQPLFGTGTTFNDLIGGIDRAAHDKRVSGLAVRLNGAHFSVAQIQELREHILRFRNAGKFTEAYGENFGGEEGGMGDYYLASVFDTIWLQPVGTVAVNGIAAEVPFVRGLLDKVGVSAQFGHKGIYKSAPESLTATGMSPPNRENMTTLLTDLSGQMVADIASARGIPAGDLAKDIDASPFDDADAVRLKLIDKAGYEDEMLDDSRARAKLAEDEDTVDLADYADATAPDERPSLSEDIEKLKAELSRKKSPEPDTAANAPSKHPKIALVYGVGDIVSGEGSLEDMGADTTADAISDATDDPDVAAIVFRIDSPGGSPEAAETIRRAIVRAQKKGKPVIVSMGGYAASGGYWIATPADKIFAQPGTITGSIGVFGGKIVLAGLWDKLGVNWETIGVGKDADMFSANKPFTDAQYAKFDQSLSSIYEAFLQRVMSGRKMTHEQAEAVAEGRVYTGRQAKEKGLVDQLGGLDAAETTARLMAKVDKSAPVILYPEPKSTIELFLSMLTDQASFRPQFRISAADVIKTLQSAAGPQPALKTPLTIIH